LVVLDKEVLRVQPQERMLQLTQALVAVEAAVLPVLLVLVVEPLVAT
jgi:hypothetical protein